MLLNNWELMEDMLDRCSKKQKSERDLICIRNFSINLLTFYIDSSTNLFST